MSRLCSFNRALVRLALLAATVWSLAGPVSAGIQDSVFSIGADGTVAFDVRDVARRDVLQRLVQGRAVELEWVDPAFADERITGVFNGNVDAVLQRLLAQTDFVAVYDRQSGKPRIARLIIVGKAASPGSPSDYQRIMGVLRRIDRAPLQVMINATIAEVTLNDTLRYGVQEFLKGKKFSGGHVNAQEIPLAPAYPGLNFIIGSFTDPRIVLDALASVTEVKVVSSPSVVVVDNQPALLKVGDEVPVSTQQTASIELPNAPIVSSICFRDTGVILKVIPRVNSSGLVTMDVEQEISAVVPQPGGPTLTPTISQRRIASTISVYSGQMVALGGLISEQHNLDKSGLPIINRVPILGELIGSNERGAKRTELIVFIRPQVIRDPRDARDVAEELRSRLQSMATPPPPPHDWHTRTR